MNFIQKNDINEVKLKLLNIALNVEVNDYKNNEYLLKDLTSVLNKLDEMEKLK